MDATAWRPTAEQVATHVAQRFNAGVPTEHTTPTADQVGEIITARVAEVRAACGRVGDYPEVHDLARETVAIGAASFIESSLFPEQGEDPSAVFLRVRYTEHKALLRAQVMSAYWDQTA